MKSSCAIVEVFYTAFKALNADERDVFMEKVFSDSSLREDFIDIALVEEAKRVKGKAISAREYFEKRRRDKKGS